MTMAFEFLPERRGKAGRRVSRFGLVAALGLIVLSAVQCSRAANLVEVPGRTEAAEKLAEWKNFLVCLVLGNPVPKGIGFKDGVVILAVASDREMAEEYQAMFGKTVRTPQEELSEPVCPGTACVSV